MRIVKSGRIVGFLHSDYNFESDFLDFKMAKRRLSQEIIINSFLFSAFDKSAGSTSLQDIAHSLGVQKASLYNHFSSKEEMYFFAVDYCRIYLDSVNFVPEDSLKDGKIYEDEINAAFRKILKRYVQLFETEPIFQIYSFVHSEQYFNGKIAKIIDGEYFKIKSGILLLLKGFSEKGKISLPENELLRELASNFTSAFLQQLDSYIMHKKEIVRQNPETGAGSLFALPTDEKSLEKILKLADFYLGLMDN